MLTSLKLSREQIFSLQNFKTYKWGQIPGASLAFKSYFDSIIIILQKVRLVGEGKFFEELPVFNEEGIKSLINSAHKNLKKLDFNNFIVRKLLLRNNSFYSAYKTDFVVSKREENEIITFAVELPYMNNLNNMKGKFSIDSKAHAPVKNIFTYQLQVKIPQIILDQRYSKENYLLIYKLSANAIKKNSFIRVNFINNESNKKLLESYSTHHIYLPKFFEFKNIVGLAALKLPEGNYTINADLKYFLEEQESEYLNKIKETIHSDPYSNGKSNNLTDLSKHLNKELQKTLNYKDKTKNNGKADIINKINTTKISIQPLLFENHKQPINSKFSTGLEDKVKKQVKYPDNKTNYNHNQGIIITKNAHYKSESEIQTNNTIGKHHINKKLLKHYNNNKAIVHEEKFINNKDVFIHNHNQTSFSTNKMDKKPNINKIVSINNMSRNSSQNSSNAIKTILKNETLNTSKESNVNLTRHDKITKKKHKRRHKKRHRNKTKTELVLRDSEEIKDLETNEEEEEETLDDDYDEADIKFLDNKYLIAKIKELAKRIEIIEHLNSNKLNNALSINKAGDSSNEKNVKIFSNGIPNSFIQIKDFILEDLTSIEREENNIIINNNIETYEDDESNTEEMEDRFNLNDDNIESNHNKTKKKSKKHKKKKHKKKQNNMSSENNASVIASQEHSGFNTNNTIKKNQTVEKNTNISREINTTNILFSHNSKENYNNENKYNKTFIKFSIVNKTSINISNQELSYNASKSQVSLLIDYAKKNKSHTKNITSHFENTTSSKDQMKNKSLKDKVKKSTQDKSSNNKADSKAYNLSIYPTNKEELTNHAVNIFSKVLANTKEATDEAESISNDFYEFNLIKLPISSKIHHKIYKDILDFQVHSQFFPIAFMEKTIQLSKEKNILIYINVILTADYIADYEFRLLINGKDECNSALYSNSKPMVNDNSINVLKLAPGEYKFEFMYKTNKLGKLDMRKNEWDVISLTIVELDI